MKEQTKINLFTRYCHYWIVKLGLDKRYKICLVKDNRISNGASVYRCDSTNEYIINYSTKILSNRVEILHIILHELGHLTYDFRYNNATDHEYAAELFALQTAKKEYPKYYKKMIYQTNVAIKYPGQEKIHVEGYSRALKELGEWYEN